ncbi:tetraprenyl-beta-curcumene synthase family protein [Paenibacillus sp.]|uniref:tetraprenyl-beta-curcumene synthase family protein n=1 Tax=Paenibacillus sp. TaxID=58172 RepID=UPI002810CC53|nr:tetraprenyl-beta-curcumene synthase family protein [Paenibacillus sp.]
MLRVYRQVLPEVARELDRWTAEAAAIPDAELRAQAIASLSTKRFHCEGGSVYALLRPERRGALIPLIVALQTISDYLDNLCDRSTSMDAADFRQLHLAMHEAVDPELPPSDYYALRAEREDGGYLRRLVETCRGNIATLPSYEAVKPYVKELVGLYGDLQVHKHIRREDREPALTGWWSAHRDKCPELGWNEFAAATGSTLGMFYLFAVAAGEGVTVGQAERARDAYFPYVCGLHILLDYLIDMEEDRIGGDLNFCEYFDDARRTAERIEWIAGTARERVRELDDRRFHGMIVEGLLALYLSDPKVRRQEDVAGVTKRLMRNSPLTRMFFWANSVWIRKRQGIDRPQIQDARS